MGVTNRLKYDPTDANSIAASSTVGSHTLAGDGTPITETGGALDVNIASGAIDFTYDYAEDAAHTSGDTGAYVLAVQQDTLAASAGDGDYASFKVNATGELYVKDTDAAGLLTTIDADTGSILTEIQSITHAEDTAHTSGDAGIMPLAVRNDAGTALAADGDYIPLSTDSSGNLRVTAAVDVDDDLADTAIENTATAVSTTAVNIVTSALANRKWLYLANEGNKSLYFGKTGVTAANGFPMHMGQQLEVRVGPSVTPQVIGGTGASSEDLRVMELS